MSFSKAHKFGERLKKAGCRVELTLAETGSAYLEVASPDGGEIAKIRFANHGQCYEADYSIDPQGNSEKFVWADLAAKWGLKVKRAPKKYTLTYTAFFNGADREFKMKFDSKADAEAWAAKSGLECKIR